MKRSKKGRLWELANIHFMEETTTPVPGNFGLGSALGDRLEQKKATRGVEKREKWRHERRSEEVNIVSRHLANPQKNMELGEQPFTWYSSAIVRQFPAVITTNRLNKWSVQNTHGDRRPCEPCELVLFTKRSTLLLTAEMLVLCMRRLAHRSVYTGENYEGLSYRDNNVPIIIANFKLPWSWSITETCPPHEHNTNSSSDKSLFNTVHHHDQRIYFLATKPNKPKLSNQRSG